MSDRRNLTLVELEILQAFADNDMSIARTSRFLYIHRNTITYHLRMIKERTGLDPRNFYDLVKLVSQKGSESE